jgi:hypothetical protein
MLACIEANREPSGGETAPWSRNQAIAEEERMTSMLCSILAQVSISGLTARCMTSPFAIALVKKLIVASAATAPSLRIGVATVVVQKGQVRGSRVA